MIAGAWRHHVRLKKLLVAPGDLQIAMSRISLEEKAMPCILRDREQPVDCCIQLCNVVLGQRRLLLWFAGPLWRNRRFGSNGSFTRGLQDAHIACTLLPWVKENLRRVLAKHCRRGDE